MKKLFAVMFLVLAVASTALAHDVTIAVTKSLDDPTPRSSVFPAYMSPVFKNYIVEQNGALLSQVCDPKVVNCSTITITGLADGTFSYRVGAVVEVTRSDGTKALTYGWSTAKSVTVNCGVSVVPDAPELGNATQVCK